MSIIYIALRNLMVIFIRSIFRASSELIRSKDFISKSNVGQLLYNVRWSNCIKKTRIKTPTTAKKREKTVVLAGMPKWHHLFIVECYKHTSVYCCFCFFKFHIQQWKTAPVTKKTKTPLYFIYVHIKYTTNMAFMYEK